jgi:hypothetical protein
VPVRSRRYLHGGEETGGVRAVLVVRGHCGVRGHGTSTVNHSEVEIDLLRMTVFTVQIVTPPALEEFMLFGCFIVYSCNAC